MNGIPNTILGRILLLVRETSTVDRSTHLSTPLPGVATLAACSLVNRQFYKNSTPLLYCEIIVDPNRTNHVETLSKLSATLGKRKELAGIVFKLVVQLNGDRRMTGKELKVSAWFDAVLKCSRCKFLTILVEGSPIHSIDLAKLANSLPNLTVLTLGGSIHIPDSGPFHFPSLTSLSLGPFSPTRHLLHLSTSTLSYLLLLTDLQILELGLVVPPSPRYWSYNKSLHAELFGGALKPPSPCSIHQLKLVIEPHNLEEWTIALPHYTQLTHLKLTVFSATSLETLAPPLQLLKHLQHLHLELVQIWVVTTNPTLLNLPLPPAPKQPLTTSFSKILNSKSSFSPELSFGDMEIARVSVTCQAIIPRLREFVVSLRSTTSAWDKNGEAHLGKLTWMVESLVVGEKGAAQWGRWESLGPAHKTRVVKK
ncbi:hypothetical protein MNV49_001472 [Pseudohyphozyma bogoriensis]|nr:hypothetical protein MNV49_001472 [Pseudohyphozyma bogoriensis]